MFRSRFEIRSVVVALIVINVVIFLATRLMGPSVSFVNEGVFLKLFALWPGQIAKYGWIWQFVTYMFLHGSELHLFFNMYALFLFGMSLEEKWGWKRFLAYYMATGIGAGVATFLWNLAQGSFVPTVGASGAIFGVLLAFGLEFPDAVLLMFFVIPMRARLAVVVFGGLELVFLLTGFMRGIGHFTHLAGLLFGYLYYLIGIRGRPGGRGGRRHGKLRAFGTPKSRRARFAENGERGSGKRGVSADMDRAVALKEKIGRALPLSRADAAFLLKLKNSFNGHRGGICEPSEFDISADSCRSCEDVYACLYRFLIGRGSPR